MTKRAITLDDSAMLIAAADREPLPPMPISKGFAVGINGLTVTGRPTFEDAQVLGDTLRTVERGIQFAIGDFVLYVEQRFGDDMASQIFDYSTGWCEETVNIYRWLAKSVAPDVRRMDRLGVRHHMAVAPLPREKQIEWLTRAAADDEDSPWKLDRLLAALKAGEDLEPTAFYVKVKCGSASEQRKLVKELESKGLECKVWDGRKRKPKALPA